MHGAPHHFRLGEDVDVTGGEVIQHPLLALRMEPDLTTHDLDTEVAIPAWCWEDKGSLRGKISWAK